ncbi:MAG: histidinol-phosphate transaminase [Steroidobacteraceae bacterium]
MSIAAGHPGLLASKAVLGLSPYVPGKPISELKREYGLRNVIKLASNENPWGPSPAALQAMHQALAEVWMYPDGSAHELKAALADFLRVSPTQITLGNASNELLLLLAEAFLTAAHSGVCSQYGFAIYALVIRATGARCIEAPALGPTHTMHYGHDLAAMARAIDADTRLVFIANPNNPTGTWIEAAALRAFIAAAPPHALIVLDEAYYEYSRLSGCDGTLEWLQEFPNLVLVRTMSKAYGLAGIRIGYAISHPEVADALNRIRPAFNVSNVAQAGAIAALADPHHLEQVVARTIAERGRMEAALRAANIAFAPSATNFLLVEVGARMPEIYEQLLRGGIIVRPMAGYGLPRHLRISVGLPEQNTQLLALLTRLLGAT